MSTTYSITDIRVGKRITGIAGQYAYPVTYRGTVTDPDGTEYSATERVQFVGNVYGGPIVMVSTMGAQFPIDRAVCDRIGGKLGPAWIKRYLQR